MLHPSISRPRQRRLTSLCCLAAALLLLVPGVTGAQTYWFESYQRAVELIDKNQIDEAAQLLGMLIDDRPLPETGVRTPGDQFLDYLPYYQRARIEFERGDISRASHSLDVSEAFGAIKMNERAMAHLSEMRMSLNGALRASRTASAAPAVSLRD